MNILEFHEYRERMNKRILSEDSLTLKRFFHLDSQAYEPRQLDKKTKELLGLVASLVLRCDDCVRYHIGESLRAAATPAEITETFEIGLTVGGSIVIPHLRRAYEFLDQHLSHDHLV